MRIAIATAFMFLLLPATGVAQIDALSLKAGTRARIIGPVAESKYTLITVESTSRDTLRYNLAQSLEPKSLPWQQIRKMDASAGTHRNFGRGLGYGLLIGAVAGAILGASSEPGQDFTRGMDAAFGGVFFGLLGGATGAVVGLAWTSERWTPVRLPDRLLTHQ